MTLDPTTLAALLVAVAGLVGALSAWLHSDATLRQAQANAMALSQLRVTAAVHEERLNGAFAPAVIAAMAPSMAAAAKLAADAAALPKPPAGGVLP